MQLEIAFLVCSELTMKLHVQKISFKAWFCMLKLLMKWKKMSQKNSRFVSSWVKVSARTQRDTKYKIVISRVQYNVLLYERGREWTYYLPSKVIVYYVPVSKFLFWLVGEPKARDVFPIWKQFRTMLYVLLVGKWENLVGNWTQKKIIYRSSST